MKKICINIIQLFRLGNVALAVLSFYLVLYGMLLPHFHIPTTFSIETIALGMALIMAAGNLVNDIFDYEIDLINKPDRLIVGKMLPKKSAWAIYVLLNAFALITCYVAPPVYFPIFGAVILLLFFYSKYLKCLPLLGNIAVALLSTLAPALSLFLVKVEWRIDILWITMAFFLTIAFCSSLLREIIKDIEDVEGDKQQNCSTFPIQYGIRKASLVANLLAVTMLIISLLFTSFCFYSKVWLLGIFGLVILISLAVLIKNISIQNMNKTQAGSISKRIKRIMMLGQLTPILYYCIH